MGMPSNVNPTLTLATASTIVLLIMVCIMMLNVLLTA